MPPKSTLPTRRILIVDDHPMMRMGLVQLIDHEADLKVAAEASNARQALESARKNQFDLVLLDISRTKTGWNWPKTCACCNRNCRCWWCPCTTK
jgi:DNA-binding NarL/FixJ family response regulator